MNAVSKIDGDITLCEYFHSVLLHVKAAECLSTLDGINYSGRVNTTESGLTCQRWDSQSPHGHRFTNPDDYPGDADGLLHLIATIMLLGYSLCIRFIILYDINCLSCASDVTLEDAANYCRNPDGSRSPWCYTTDVGVRWQYCDIPLCCK